MGDLDENGIIDLPDSQPFFTEEEKDIIIQRKRQFVSLSNMDESQSQSLLAPKKKRTEKSVPSSTQTSKEIYSSENPDQENEQYKCVLCNRISNQEDFRNKYYAKLISSELQFVEPCLRTYVYVEILKLIHRNKYGHIPLDDTEIK